MRIAILHTGGTIAMQAGPRGHAPDPAFPARLLAWIESNRALRGHDIAVRPLDPPLDSADAVPADWFALAGHVERAARRAAAVVVLHGTDTMAYAASAVSFLLAGLARPVIFTGAQVPWSMPGSDAAGNVAGALDCALDGRLREIAVFFGGRLLRANRCRKVDSEHRRAFDSPAWPPLARHDGRLRMAPAHLLSPGPARPLRAVSPPAAGAVLVKVFPGLPPRLVEAAAEAAGPAGLVLELYGAGTAATGDPRLLAAVRRIAATGVPVVGVSQCLRGCVRLGHYETGRRLRDAGVIDGADLTPEAALAKLTVLAARPAPAAPVAEAVQESWAGEIMVADHGGPEPGSGDSTTEAPGIAGHAALLAGDMSARHGG